MHLANVHQVHKSRQLPAGAVRDRENAFRGTHPAADHGRPEPRIAGGHPHRPFAAHRQSHHPHPLPINFLLCRKNIDAANQVPKRRCRISTVRKGRSENAISAAGEPLGAAAVNALSVENQLGRPAVAVQAEHAGKRSPAFRHCPQTLAALAVVALKRSMVQHVCAAVFRRFRLEIQWALDQRMAWRLGGNQLEKPPPCLGLPRQRRVASGGGKRQFILVGNSDLGLRRRFARP